MRRSALFSSLLAGSLPVSAPAWADVTDPPGAITISGSVSAVSDYRFRGISASGGKPAVQAAIAINHESGFYAGVWGSSLKDTPTYGEAEVDLYAGWTGEIGSGLTADAGVLYYAYPGGHAGHAEFFEPYASLSTTLGPATAKVGVAWAWSQKALGKDDSLYVYTDLGAGLPGTPISLSAHLGYADGALSPKMLTLKGQGGGFDYALGASYALTNALSLGLAYNGVEGRALKNYSDDAVVGTLKLAF